MVAGSVKALAYFQEGRAQATLKALNSRLALNASVERDGVCKTVPAAELVCGDIVKLSLGGVRTALLYLPQRLLGGVSGFSCSISGAAGDVGLTPSDDSTNSSASNQQKGEERKPLVGLKLPLINRELGIVVLFGSSSRSAFSRSRSVTRPRRSKASPS